MEYGMGMVWGWLGDGWIRVGVMGEGGDVKL